MVHKSVTTVLCNDGQAIVTSKVIASLTQCWLSTVACFQGSTHTPTLLRALAMEQQSALLTWCCTAVVIMLPIAVLTWTWISLTTWVSRHQKD